MDTINEAKEDLKYRKYTNEISRFPEWDKMHSEEYTEKDRKIDREGEMKPGEFISFENGMPIRNKWIVVTNNIKAKNAHGEMSHVWLTSFVTESKEGDEIVTFDAADREILGLTHYKYV